jgi:ribonuclease HI
VLREKYYEFQKNKVEEHCIGLGTNMLSGTKWNINNGKEV